MRPRRGDAVKWMSRELRQGEWAIWGALAGDIVAKKKIEVEIGIDGGLEAAVDRLEQQIDSVVSGSSYALLIRRCGDVADLDRGKRVHAHIRRNGRDGDTFLGNLVVEMYGKFGCLRDARDAFERIAQPNEFSANLMVAALARSLRLDEATEFLNQFSWLADSVAWNTILAAYAASGHTSQAVDLFKSMPAKCAISWNTMISAMADRDCVIEAVNTFQKMPQHSLVSWNSMISAYAQGGHAELSLQLFLWMPDRDLVSWIQVLRCLSRQIEVVQANNAFEKMPQRNVHAWIAVVQAYAQAGDIEMAKDLFDEIPENNLISWNAMIWCYSINHRVDDAKILFDALPEMDVISCNTITNAFVSSRRMREARQFFETMPERDIVSWNTLLQGFADEESSNFDLARSLFDKMPLRGLLAWNLAINISMLQGDVCAGETVFHQMPGRSFSSWNALHGGYVENGALGLAEAAMDRMPALDRVVWTVMIGGYARAGFLAEAEDMIRKMPDRDVVAWNSLLQAFVERGAAVEESKRVFDCMAERNIVSWSVLIGALVRRSKHQREPSSRIEMAKSVFGRMPSRDTVSSNAMVVFFADNGLISEAREVVESMDRKNAVSLNALLGCYVKSGCNKEAVELYRSMDLEASSDPQQGYSSKSFVWILEACARSVALSAGRSIHCDVNHLQEQRRRQALAPSLAAALVDMYGKCGELDEARKIFDALACRSASCWNSMIAAYAQSGHGKQALELFLLMGLDGLAPNRMTLVIVLSACSHSGLVSAALDVFHASTDLLRKDHFGIMVDLLGRAGRISEAREFIAAMPVEPDRVAWTAMLGACRVHGDGGGGAAATERVIELDPFAASPYVAMASIE